MACNQPRRSIPTDGLIVSGWPDAPSEALAKMWMPE